MATVWLQVSPLKSNHPGRAFCRNWRPQEWSPQQYQRESLLESLETHPLASHVEKSIFKWEPPRSMVGENADTAFHVGTCLSVCNCLQQIIPTVLCQEAWLLQVKHTTGAQESAAWLRHAQLCWVTMIQRPKHLHQWPKPAKSATLLHDQRHVWEWKLPVDATSYHWEELVSGAFKFENPCQDPKPMPFSKHTALCLNSAPTVPAWHGAPAFHTVAASHKDSKLGACRIAINSFPKIKSSRSLGNLKDLPAFPDHKYATDQDLHQKLAGWSENPSWCQQNTGSNLKPILNECIRLLDENLSWVPFPFNMSAIPRLFRRCPAFCLLVWQDFPAPKPPSIHLCLHLLQPLDFLKRWRRWRQLEVGFIFLPFQHTKLPWTNASKRHQINLIKSPTHLQGFGQMAMSQQQTEAFTASSWSLTTTIPRQTGLACHPCGAPWQHQIGGLAESEWSPAGGPPKQPWLQVSQSLILSFIVIYVVFVWNCSCGTDSCDSDWWLR